MKTIEEKLSEILTTRRKPEMVRWVRRTPDSMPVLIRLASGDQGHLSWRAAWVLWDAMEPDDPRVIPHLSSMIKRLPSLPDNLIREWLMVMQRLTIPDKLEGRVFDFCLTVWEEIDKQPSVRLNALKLILKMAKHYPELISELGPVFEDRYTDTLTPGARRSFEIMTAPLLKKKLSGPG
ncbi:MAG: hypothetical protein HUU10_11155 [Bacteroidetes bacterium]|nr:hypothetical protein [Bacteroidota bacterium]